MARVFSLIVFVCILFGLVYTESPTPRCDDANKTYGCRPDWQTGKCVDRFNSPPFAPTPPNVCKCYCPDSEGLWENSAGNCVPFDNCD